MEVFQTSSKTINTLKAIPCPVTTTPICSRYISTTDAALKDLGVVVVVCCSERGILSQSNTLNISSYQDARICNPAFSSFPLA